MKRVGRFAPTPSGDLHIGSLVAAVASAADAKHHRGEHLVRIDDIDPPRTVPGAIARIEKALAHYQIPCDKPIQRQSQSLKRYQQSLSELAELGGVFLCACSRKELAGANQCVSNCQDRPLTNVTSISEQLDAALNRYAVRLNIEALVSHIKRFDVTDAVQPNQPVDNVTSLGNPVLWRKDGFVSYLLATAIDDSDTVTDVVRGADLWSETPTQQLVIQLLQRPVPRYAHVPCAVDNNQQKLGKQTRAESIHAAEPLANLQKVWQFLGQAPFDCGSLASFWENAGRHWSMDKVPKVSAKIIE